MIARIRIRYWSVFAILLGFCSSSHAHFPIWLIDQPYPAMGESVRTVYAYGHPYEREFEDLERPQRAFIISPAGASRDANDLMDEITLTEGEETAKAWSLPFTPSERGDFILAADSSISVGRSGDAWQEFSKAIVHVERSRGWRNRTGQPVEFLPLSRPFGLAPGVAFSAQLLRGDEPVSGHVVYIERLNEAQPDSMPPGRYITNEVITDPNGVFTATLHEPGWWVLASYVDSLGEINHEGETRTLNGSCVLMIYVDGP